MAFRVQGVAIVAASWSRLNVYTSVEKALLFAKFARVGSLYTWILSAAACCEDGRLLPYGLFPEMLFGCFID